jgi:hypothetical protein
MSAATYLSLVNNVLARLRESQVNNVSDTEYSILIGKLVNDSKREVEDAWDWECLKTSFNVTTSNGVSEYAVTNLGTRFKIIDQPLNMTSRGALIYRPYSWFTENLTLNPTPAAGTPENYTFHGTNSSGDIKMLLYPVPNGVQTIRLNVINPEPELTTNTSTTLLPDTAITALAWAKAIEERGEDGGVNVNSQYAVARQILADTIAMEANRYVNTTWDAV